MQPKDLSESQCQTSVLSASQEQSHVLSESGFQNQALGETTNQSQGQGESQSQSRVFGPKVYLSCAICGWSAMVGECWRCRRRVCEGHIAESKPWRGVYYPMYTECAEWLRGSDTEKGE